MCIIYVIYICKFIFVTLEISQWIGTLTFLTSCRGPSSDSQYPNVILSNFRKSYAFFDFCGHQTCMWYINMHTDQTLIHIFI